MGTRALGLLLFALVVWGCSGSDEQPIDSMPDLGGQPDVGVADVASDTGEFDDSGMDDGGIDDAGMDVGGIDSGDDTGVSDRFEASGPDLTNETSVTFTFSGRDEDTFECRLDGGEWESCQSPYTIDGLEEGQHTFEVRRTRLPAEMIEIVFTVDLTAPETTLVPPTDPEADASFEFSSDDPEASFECRLLPDQSAWQSCTSPADRNGLANGEYTFEVRAVDPAGNVDETPSEFIWTVETRWVDVSKHGDDSCGVRQNGELWCWGRRTAITGRFEDFPFRVGNDSDWESVVLGDAYQCAIKDDASLWCWGSNSDGQLGISSTNSMRSPTRVGSSNDWVEVAPLGDGKSTCGRRSNRTIWCWGAAQYGVLGNSTTSGNENSPVQVGSDADWAHLGTAENTVCATKTDGSLWCWGRDRFGSLGLGATGDVSAPTRVGSDTDWTTMTTSVSPFFCALKTDGALWCWGRIPGRSNASTPTQVGVATDWADVRGGDDMACALKTDDSLHCWGRTRHGRLGHGAFVYFDDVALPTPVVPTSARWQASAHAEDSSCAIRDDGSLWCWGLNTSGQLGNGYSGGAITPPVEVVPGAVWADVSAGDTTCAIRDDDSLWCWGVNVDGQLDGQPMTGYGVVDLPVQIGNDSWSDVSAGGRFTCGIQTNGSLWCWGDNGQGGLGQGDTADYTGLVRVGTDNDWGEVAVSTTGVALTPRGSACATKTNGTLWCWGDNASNELGITGSEALSPTQVGTDTDWATVHVADRGTCALKTSGALYCWGLDRTDRFGNGATTNYATPTQIGVGSWARFALGHGFSCGILDTGELQCAGRNDEGELGNGTRTDSDVFVQIGTQDWSHIAVGPMFAVNQFYWGFGCGIRNDSTLWCWGRGEPTVRATGNFATPLQITNETNWADVEAGQEHMCAIKDDDSLWCWGDGADGRVGAGLWRTATPTEAVGASR